MNQYPTFPQWIINLFLFSIQGLALTVVGNLFMLFFTPLIRWMVSNQIVVDRLIMALASAFGLAVISFIISLTAAKTYLAQKGE